RTLGVAAAGARGHGLRSAHRLLRGGGGAPMTLRGKLLLALAPLALALALLGGVSLWTVARLGLRSQVILKDNYRSVLAAERMKEALERLDSAALFRLAGRPDQAAPLV